MLLNSINQISGVIAVDSDFKKNAATLILVDEAIPA